MEVKHPKKSENQTRKPNINILVKISELSQATIRKVERCAQLGSNDTVDLSCYS